MKERGSNSRVLVGDEGGGGVWVESNDGIGRRWGEEDGTMDRKDGKNEEGREKY
jgi:hypothetical protein